MPSSAMARIHVALTEEPLDPTGIAALVQEPTKGGVVLFLGDVRGKTGDRTTSYLLYEAYEEMALPALEDLARRASEAHAANVAVVHRLGRLEPGETSVICAAACAHRADAFLCCKWLIDQLKQEIPIWKKEVGPDGSEWVGS